MNPAGYIIVMTTCATQEEANRLASELVQKRLSACVQVSPVSSVYWWNDKVESSQELRLLIKSKASDYAAVEELIQARHSYNLPEIVAVPISAGSAAYLRWIDTETAR